MTLTVTTSLPLLSIVLSTYNRVELLEKTLHSILNQSYINTEILLLNDNSNDGTEKFLSKISSKDSRVKVLTNTVNNVGKVGHTEILKQLISKKKGEFFITAADDDYYPNKDFFSNAMNKFIKYKNLSMVIGNQVNYNFSNNYQYKFYNIDEINNFLKEKNANFYHHNQILPSGLINGETYLELFSKEPLKINISTNGTIFSSHIFEKSLSLTNTTYSKMQGGFEINIPSAFFGNIFFINEPCVVIGVNSNSLSFGQTQKLHMKDQIFSVENAFKNLDLFKLRKTNYNKKKKFIYNILKTYIYHSIEIIVNKKLTNCQAENIKEYVNLFDVVKFLIKCRIFKFDIKLLIRYLITKYFLNK